jgi:hypothetical protein
VAPLLALLVGIANPGLFAQASTNLVQNGGFEVNRLQGWTVSGEAEGVFASIGTSHSGVFSAVFGATNNPAYISQNLSVAAGQEYRISFWLAIGDNQGGIPNKFVVKWGNTVLLDYSNRVIPTWTNLQFLVTASSSQVVLEFGGQDSPDYIALDDVSVVVSDAVTDTTPPTASLTAPANGATVSGTIALSANAADNVGVSRVEFYRDGVLVVSDTASPYSTSFDTTTVANGSHAFFAKAFDAAGNVATTSTNTVTVSNAVTDTTPPTVNLTAPTNGATVSGTITLSANAADNVGVSRVEFYRAGVLVISDTTSPYSTSFDTTTVANGSHAFFAKAFDAAGNVATSSTNTVTVVDPGSQPPEFLQITKEANVVRLTWSAVVGRVYQLHYSTNLAASWKNLGTAITATNATLVTTDTPGADQRRFYRITQMP